MHPLNTPDPGCPRRRLAPVLCVLGPLCLWAAAGLPALAEEPDDQAASTSSEDETPRLRVHGFLTQAYAASDGEQVVGIPESGTTDYRTAALQLRYRMSDAGAFVIQLAHERLGKSPRAGLRDDVELDWIFYRHRLGDYTEVKVGRIPIPQGLFNEIRDVGTALPFYRPPQSVYGESAFATESVDGAVLSHSLFLGPDWLVDLDAFYGGWEFVESLDGETFVEARVEDALGLQVWARPPVPGLRLGLSAQTYLLSEGIRPPGEKERWRAWTGSLEWSTRRLVARAEYHETSGDADYTAYYGQVGVRLTPRLTLNLQVERAELAFESSRIPVGPRFEDTEVAGFSYAFNSDVVAKVEVHRTEGHFRSEAPGFSFFGPPADVTYGIVSLATSF